MPRETLKMLKDGGLRLLLVGYEFGNQQILHNIKKGMRVEVAEKFTKDCHELGIAIHGTFILGLPGETKETIQETIQFAREINPHTIQVSLAAPYPGTFLYNQAVENGWLDDANAELVDDSGVQIAPLHYPHLSHTEIFQSVEDFYQQFYFRAPQDRLDRRRDGAQPRDDEAPPARGRRVLPLPAGAPGGGGLKQLIVTADDFGLSVEVNEAVEAAHRTGILTAASLMVAGGGARRCRGARAAHAGPAGRAASDPGRGRAGPAAGADPGAGPPGRSLPRRHGRDEPGTGGQRRAHGASSPPRSRRSSRLTVAPVCRSTTSTPTSTSISTRSSPAPLMRIGLAHGMRALRVPREPGELIRSLDRSRSAGRLDGVLVANRVLARRLAEQARATGVAVTERVFGLAWSGALTRDRVLRLIAALPDGTSEVYAHPATADRFPGSAPGYRYRDELEALTSPDVAAAVRAAGATLCGYGDLRSS